MAEIAALGFAIDSNRDIRRATNDLNALTGAAGQVQAGVERLRNSFMRMAIAAGAAVSTALSLKALFDYKDAMAEVSTLVDTSKFSMFELSNEALRQAKAYGNLQGQVKAYYQIISAGAGTVGQATEILDTSNKLAIGGVTDIATAADGLTSILNAYGDKVGGAMAVSDAMFVAMRAGKTTIGELAATLGRVAPLAVQTGTSFDELTAAVAALTKGGITTNESITGVRAILAAVAKPSSEAAELAKQLGLEFNSSALAAKGFAKFLEDVKSKTGGSTDALAILFGGVEAIIPMLALSGQAGKDFANILEQMKDKAGSTEEAFKKMESSPGFQMQRVVSNLTSEFIKMASAFGDMLVPALRTVADNMNLLPGIIQEVFNGFVGLGVLLGIKFVGEVGLASAAIISLEASLKLLRVAIAGTGIGVLAIILGDVTYNIYQAIIANDELAAKTNEAGNSASGVYERLKTGLLALLETFNYVSKTIAAFFMGAFATIYQAYAGMHNLVSAGLRMLGFEIGDMDTMWATKVFIRLNDEAQESGAKAGELWGQAFGVTASKEAVGFMAELQKSLGNIGNIGQKIKPGEFKKNSNFSVETDDAKKLKDAYDKIINTSNQRIDQIKLEAQVLGMESEAAARLQYEQELLNKATNSHIVLTQQQRNQLMEIAAQTAAVQEQTRKLKEAYDLGQSVTRGFFSDFQQNVRNGTSLWESFGRAADGVLNRIMDKATQMAADGIWDMIFKSTSSSGIGGIGSLFSGLFNANGNVFSDGVSGYSNQIVARPTAFRFAKGGRFGIMGEAGPEAIMPLSRDSSGRLGVQIANGSPGSGGYIRVEVTTKVDKDGNLKPFVQQVSGEVAGQAIVYASPGIVEQSTRATGQSLGRGSYDREMAGYGVSRQPRSR